MDKLGIIAIYYYENKQCILALPQVEGSLTLKQGEGIVEATLCDEEVMRIKYQISDGITRISLKNLSEIYFFKYKLHDKTVMIKL